MHRKFIAFIISTAVAVTALSAPARADTDDIARALVGIAALALIGKALSDNDNGLNRLRQIYGTQMDNTPFREAFRLITNNTDSGPDEFLRLSERFEEIGRFQASCRATATS